MKTVKVKFVDFHSDFNLMDNEFTKILSKHFRIVIDNNPDYIFYSVFGYEHLNYDCVRIFYTGECIVPNFNECDYAIGFDRIDFGDRYIRIPLFALFQYNESYMKLLNREVLMQGELQRKTGFCSFVYSNCFAQDTRTQIFELLSQYKTVSSGGRYRNNIGGAVKDKEDFQRQHKFAIAFENASYDGYATEKLVEAFAAGTIPIYYGDPHINQDFNSHSFINCHEFNSLSDVVQRVIEIDTNDDLYLEIRNSNPLEGKSFIDGERLLDDFLQHIFMQEYSLSFRRPLSRSAAASVDVIKRHRWYEENVYKYINKIENQIIRYRTGTILSKRRG